MHRYYQQRAEAHGIAGLPGRSGEDIAEQYASVTGYTPADLHWFQVLGPRARRDPGPLRPGRGPGSQEGGQLMKANPDEALGIRPVLAELLG